ncbi:MAG TPA: ABC transporter permease subunit [Pseudonocardiaceae bacterium]|jgi:ABC-2 type transport system permease protein|nr:ABC transporter permease subunit [Pseudonocardiaceae bacterium]
MTTVATTPTYVLRTATAAPIGRLLRSELAWVFKRPRTWIALTLLGLVPVVIAIGAKVGSSRPGGGGLIGTLVGNGLVLPIVSLSVTLALLLPLVGAMWSADALAGESAHSTLRYLLLAPVGRVRLLVIKSFGVATAVLAASLLIAAVGMIAGYVVFGSHDLITLSGTTVSFGQALWRVFLATLWTTVQVWAVCAVALAVSACTEHPMVVMAATLAGAVVFGVLQTIPALSWLQPYLLTNSWQSMVDVLRDPLPTDNLIHGVIMAVCYAVVGWSLALARVVTKDG